MTMIKTFYEVILFISILIRIVRADCNSPPIIPNASSNINGSLPYPDGTTIRYDCNSGYNTGGTSRYYTCSNTDWTGGNIRCERIYCSYVSPPENGKVINTPTNEVGTLIKFACNEGHDMSGSDEILCRTDGNWNPPTAPTCTARDCGEFGSIQYASLFQDNSETERNHYDSVVEVTCQNGYLLNGPPRVKCDANGQWGERPTCASLQCSAYPNINASCISNSELIGMFYFILCKENISTRIGPDAAECVDGEWDSEEMACFCDCNIPELNTGIITVSNLNDYGNIFHDATMEWTCTGGSSKTQADYVICTDGVLRVMKDGKELTFTNPLNPSDINSVILSNLCTLPPTTDGESTIDGESRTDDEPVTPPGSTGTTMKTWTGKQSMNSATNFVTGAMSVCTILLCNFFNVFG